MKKCPFYSILHPRSTGRHGQQILCEELDLSDIMCLLLQQMYQGFLNINVFQSHIKMKNAVPFTSVEHKRRNSENWTKNFFFENED